MLLFITIGLLSLSGVLIEKVHSGWCSVI